MVRLVTQLDGSGTAAFDCGPATTAMGADRASGGSVRPSIRVVRTKMGVPRGPTDPWDWKRALDEFDGAMKREGLRPIPSRIVDGGELAELHDLLVEKRRGVLLAIDYGTVARLAPRLWSSTSFRGNHAVLVDGGREHDGRDEGRVFDPLADGRTIGGKRMVRGPRWWSWSLIRAAAANVKDRDGDPIYPGVSLDPLAAMATTDEAKLRELVAGVSLSRPASPRGQTCSCRDRTRDGPAPPPRA